MSEMTSRRAETEGRRGSRIDLQEGGCYFGIPQNPGHAVHEPVTINPVSTKSGAVHMPRHVVDPWPLRDVLDRIPTHPIAIARVLPGQWQAAQTTTPSKTRLVPAAAVPAPSSDRARDLRRVPGL